MAHRTKRFGLAGLAPLFAMALGIACGGAELDGFGGMGVGGMAPGSGAGSGGDTPGSIGLPGPDNSNSGSGVTGGGAGASGAQSSGSGSGPVTPSAGVPASTTVGPHFAGSGASFRPLTTGCGPNTAGLCTGTCERQGGDPAVTVVRRPQTLCFSGEGDASPEDPSVVIEQVIERLGGAEYLHVRVTFDPSFVDATYGEGSCCGWPEKRGHRFSDLVKSDHTELLLTDGTGANVMHIKLDYISEDPTRDCGYGTLGVRGGDGSVLIGDPAWVLAASSSLDRNLNGCGYCKNVGCASSGDCTIDSPTTGPGYPINASAPNWDYRQVYEVWIDMAAFAGKGFDHAYVTYTHASPSKAMQDTLNVKPTPCPPTWNSPYCPPGVVDCFGTGDGGNGSSGESDGGQSGGGEAGGGQSGGGESDAGQSGGGGAGGQGGASGGADDGQGGHGGEPDAVCAVDGSPCSEIADCCTAVCCGGVCGPCIPIN